MPTKRKPVAGPAGGQPWTAAEIAIVRKHFATKTTAALAKTLNRTPRSVSYCAANLGITKTAKHRAEQSRINALSAGLTADEMSVRGSAGGKLGGPARAEKLSPARRTKIAKDAIKARWKKASEA